jgi:hypothetical protein
MLLEGFTPLFPSPPTHIFDSGECIQIRGGNPAGCPPWFLRDGVEMVWGLAAWTKPGKVPSFPILLVSEGTSQVLGQPSPPPLREGGGDGGF